jgi:hypothetical protein
MRTVIRQSACALGLLLAASSAWAQPADKPEAGGIHRMVIYNGPARTVHYVSGPDVAPADAAAVRDLERAENDVALADELQQLKLEYVRNERDMEAHRHNLQRLLYGYSSETTGNALTWASGNPGFGYGYPGYGWPYWGGYGYGYGSGYGWGYSNVSVNSLANGIGDEGVIKTTLAHSLLDPAAPDYGARAVANYNAALANASKYESVRSALGLKQALPAPPPPMPPPAPDKK